MTKFPEWLIAPVLIVGILLFFGSVFGIAEYLDEKDEAQDRQEFHAMCKQLEATAVEADKWVCMRGRNIVYTYDTIYN